MTDLEQAINDWKIIMINSIGDKIKSLRMKKKYTLKQLSEETGLSTGFLSQLERGMSSIAIDSLAKITEVLGVDLSSFFENTESPQKDIVKRSFDMPPTYVTPQILYYNHCGDNESHDLFPRVFHLMPFANADDALEMYSHEGEEFIYILEGIVTVYVGDMQYILYPGDSVHIRSNTEHNWMNRTNKMAKLLTVNFPNPLKEG